MKLVKDIVDVLASYKQTLAAIGFQKNKFSRLAFVANCEINSVDSVKGVLSVIKDALDSADAMVRGIPGDVEVSNYMTSMAQVRGSLSLLEYSDDESECPSRDILDVTALDAAVMELAGYAVFYERLVSTTGLFKNIGELILGLDTYLRCVIANAAKTLGVESTDEGFYNGELPKTPPMFNLYTEQKFFTDEELAAIKESERVAKEKAEREQALIEATDKMNQRIAAVKLDWNTKDIRDPEVVLGMYEGLESFGPSAIALLDDLKQAPDVCLSLCKEVSVRNLKHMTTYLSTAIGKQVTAVNPDTYAVISEMDDNDSFVMGSLIRFET